MYRKAIVLLTAAAICMTLAAGCGSRDGSAGHGAHGKEGAAEQELYTCPMHPSVVQSTPGACPVCNMALVKKSAQAPMKPEDEAMLRTVSLSQAQRVMANIATVPAQQRAMTGGIRAVGVVDFAEPLQYTVSARFRGRVEQLFVAATGAQVRKGQPLFTLYSPEVFAAQQDFLAARRGTDRDAGGSPVNTMEESARKRLVMHYGLSATQMKELAESGAPLQTITVHAPASGTVIRKQVQEGQYVEEGSTLYQLADLSRVWISVEVPESDIRFVRVGGNAALETDVYPGEQFRGRVTFIDPVMNAQTRSVRVRTEFANPGGRLKPGMYARALLETRTGSSLAVPVNAVIETGRRSVVWVEVRKNQFEPRTVRTGARGGGWVEILDGLQEGEMVAATGGYLLDSESELQNPLGTEQTAAAPVEMEGSRASDAPSAPEKRISENTADAAAPSAGPQVRRVRVDGEYFPATITVKKDLPVRILFDRREDAKCSDEIVLADFGIRKQLAPFAVTPVQFTPKKAGRFRIACGMDMMEMTLVVTP